MASTPGKTVFSAGQTFNSSVFFDGVGGEWTFLDEFTVGNGAGIFLYGGTIRTNNQTVTAGYFTLLVAAVLNWRYTWDHRCSILPVQTALYIYATPTNLILMPELQTSFFKE
ncbi:MAG: hypothetical protein IPN33_19405 [Saprospiraceae bacterium]|nr:hypothetical protein [Saprospiraceae bacterium]